MSVSATAAAAAAAAAQLAQWLGKLAWPVSLALLALGAAAWRARISSRQGSPTNWPLLGMLPAILVNLHRIYEWVTEVLIAHGGSFQFYGPWFSCMHSFITADPRNVEHALRSHFPNFPKGRDFSAIFHDLLGHGIFNADDELWRLQRKTASLQLNSRACRKFTDDTVFAAVETKLLPVLQDACDKASLIDLQMLMLRFTFDTVCVVGLGVDTRCLSRDLPVVPFAHAFETALDCTTLRFLLPRTWWQALRWLKFGKERDMPKALAIVDGFAEEVIATRRKELRLGEGCKNDLLSCFMRMEAHDDKFLKDVIVNFLVAGRDTSALALSWFFWLVATHPEVEKKIVEELNQVMQDGPPHPPNDRKPWLTRDKLHQLTYLHASLNEALRLYPSVPVEVKQVMKDDLLPDGNHVKKDHKFIYSIYTMGRMQSIWGKDCASYRPERWLSCNGSTCAQLLNFSPFEYAVFNAGPRTCLGKDMAYLLMKAAASILHITS